MYFLVLKDGLVRNPLSALAQVFPSSEAEAPEVSGIAVRGREPNLCVEGVR